MNVRDALKSSGIPQLDAELLLAEVLGKDRTWLVAHSDAILLPDEEMTFAQFIERRKDSEPLAYILRRKEFYGRDFYVTPEVLIPRPSTEACVDLTKKLLATGEEEIREVDTNISVISKLLRPWQKNIRTIVDIGTGSGCIAVTLACEIPSLECIGTDISAQALQVAQRNAELHGVKDRVEYRKGSLLEPIQDLHEPFIVISNPPYIPEGEKLMKDVENYEPHLALFGGKNGTELLERLSKEMHQNPYCIGFIIECRTEQLTLFDKHANDDSNAISFD